jgi:hypothetical protein
MTYSIRDVKLALLLLLISLFAVPPVIAQQAKPEAEWNSLLQTIRPAKGEDLFAGIPWITDLWEAREKAAKEGKPILLWEMDGHPLGCG